MFPNSPVLHSLFRTVIAALVFGVPVLMTQFPTVGDLSVSTIVFYILHYLETKYVA